jgi:exodeoxyribonuclease V alpha subunit
MKLDHSQLSAIDRATHSRVSIITGGAGTGKTTIIRTATEQLEAANETVSLAAFAGKAAARIREACDHPASTIHRLLGYNGSEFTTGDLTSQTIIIDEASMIDAALLSEIIRRNPKRLVLVGDPGQLPPVGRGQPFHDALSLLPGLVSTLSTCYRATEAVFQSASIIRAGGRPALQLTSAGEYWEMRNTGDPERTQAALLRWITDEGAEWDYERDIVLVARNGDSDEDHCTQRAINRAVVDAIAPRDWRDKKKIFLPGDRVINTQNLPKLDQWNGSTGTVHAVDIDGGVWVRTDIPAIDWSKTRDERNPVYTSHVLFGKDIRRHLQLAYALTVHKSQGSQYRNVLFAGFDRDSFGLLDRSLLYTAVTRAKSACVVCGELSAIYGAIDRVSKKRTVMQELARSAA